MNFFGRQANLRDDLIATRNDLYVALGLAMNDVEPTKCIIIEGSWDHILPLLPEVIALTITDPPYESLERHRAVGTTTRLKDSKASSNPWFSILANTRYWDLLYWLHEVQRPNTHLYCFCDCETEHVIYSGRNPFYLKNDAVLVEYTNATFGGLLAPLHAVVGKSWHPWPTLTWLKVRETVDKTFLETLLAIVNNPLLTARQKIVEIAYKIIRKGTGYHWATSTERILFLEKGKRALNDRSYPNVLVGKRAGRNDPPTQKPLEVVERLVLNSTVEREWVLDPFAGSGVVAEAALKHGRRSVICDVNMKYINENEAINKLEREQPGSVVRLKVQY